VKLASIHHAGQVVGAVVVDDAAYLLPSGLTLGDLVALGLEEALQIGAQASRGEPIELDDGALALPYYPPSVRDFVTFESHVEGVRRSIEGSPGVPEAWYDAPTFYFTNPHALFGPGQPVPKPALTSALDYEMEVGVVVGPNLEMFGYTIVNDWSARDLQAREMQVGLGPAKGKDFATSVGPYLVTADELAPYVNADGFLDLDCRAYVNGEQVGHDRLSHMRWTFPEMVAYAARDSVVKPGDLLASGTTGGGGCLAELWGRNGSRTPPPLEVGDEVRLHVEALGSLVGTVSSPLTPPGAVEKDRGGQPR
jgi:2-keto-4-pentenoate hydratase/2-oxohepta-3-ene-1,7-dioic acid hydratase in catechol pathway